MLHECAVGSGDLITAEPTRPSKKMEVAIKYIPSCVLASSVYWEQDQLIYTRAYRS